MPLGPGLGVTLDFAALRRCHERYLAEGCFPAGASAPAESGSGSTFRKVRRAGLGQGHHADAGGGHGSGRGLPHRPPAPPPCSRARPRAGPGTPVPRAHGTDSGHLLRAGGPFKAAKGRLPRRPPGPPCGIRTCRPSARCCPGRRPTAASCGARSKAASFWSSDPRRCPCAGGPRKAIPPAPSGGRGRGGTFSTRRACRFPRSPMRVPATS